MTAGLAYADADFVALTDDDAEPVEDWLERIAVVFEEQDDVAGVGGRDDQVGTIAEQLDVGRVQWFGRVIGNHHLGAGPPRDVDVLKGVCCAFRIAPPAHGRLRRAAARRGRTGALGAGALSRAAPRGMAARLRSGDPRSPPRRLAP